MNESPRKIRARRAGLLIFLLYIGALTYFLFFADRYGHTPGAVTEYRCNMVPGHEILRYIRARESLGHRAFLLNIAGNVVGFMPFGFFFPIISRRFRSIWKTTASAAFLSIIVESVQLLAAAGCCDIDDVILNALGAALGYLLFLAADDTRIRAADRYRERKHYGG